MGNPRIPFVPPPSPALAQLCGDIPDRTSLQLIPGICLAARGPNKITGGICQRTNGGTRVANASSIDIQWLQKNDLILDFVLVCSLARFAGFPHKAEVCQFKVPT